MNGCCFWKRFQYSYLSSNPIHTPIECDHWTTDFQAVRRPFRCPSNAALSPAMKCHSRCTRARLARWTRRDITATGCRRILPARPSWALRCLGFGSSGKIITLFPAHSTESAVLRFCGSHLGAISNHCDLSRAECGGGGGGGRGGSERIPVGRRHSHPWSGHGHRIARAWP